MENRTSPRPFRIVEDDKVLATASTYRRAQIAVARRIGADVEGRILTIEGPTGRTVCTNNGLTIRYEAA